MKRVSFCSIGDCNVDVYKNQRYALLGGTAFYAALAASEADTTTSLVSSVGDDRFGKEYLSVCKKNNIDASHLRRSNKPTSHVEIQLDNSHVPQFAGWEHGALTELLFSPRDISFIGSHQIARVTLFTTFEYVFDQVFKMKLPHTYKVADFSGDSLYSKEKEILEKYIDGFDLIAKSITKDQLSDLSYFTNLSKQTKKLILLTAGRNGSIALYNDQKFTVPVQNIVEKDTTGAGDVYLAIFSIMYKQTNDIQLSMQKATDKVGEFLQNQSYRIKVSL